MSKTNYKTQRGGVAPSRQGEVMKPSKNRRKEKVKKGRDGFGLGKQTKKHKKYRKKRKKEPVKKKNEKGGQSWRSGVQKPKR